MCTGVFTTIMSHDLLYHSSKTYAIMHMKLVQMHKRCMKEIMDNGMTCVEVFLYISSNSSPGSQHDTSPKPGCVISSANSSGKKCRMPVTMLITKGKPQPYKQYSCNFFLSLLKMPSKGMPLAVALKITRVKAQEYI